MKTCWLIFSFSSLVLLLNTRYGDGRGYPPVMLTVEKKDDSYSYKLDAYDAIKRNLDDENEVASRNIVPRALMCCPNKSSGITSNLFIRNFIRNKYSFPENKPFCGGRYKPLVEKLWTDSTNPYVIAYETGYKICDSNSELKAENLTSFEKKCKFFAILEIIINEQNLTTRQASYELFGSAESTWIEGDCDGLSEDNILSNTYTHLKLLYSKKNQNQVLQNLVLPLKDENTVLQDTKPFKRLKNEPVTAERESSAYHLKKEKVLVRDELVEEGGEDLHFLVAQPLAPRNHFGDETLALPSCFYLNTAPMWKSRVLAWKRKQDYIRKVADKISGRKLTIISGTYGVLKMNFVSDYEHDGGDNSALKEIYLSPKSKEIAVPEIFWTVVKYEPSISAFQYGVILVTDNRSWGKEGNVCPQPIKCETLGWHEVNNDVTGPLTYCCRFVEANLMALKVNTRALKLTKNLLDFNLRIAAMGKYSGQGTTTKDIYQELSAAHIENLAPRYSPLVLSVTEKYYQLDSFETLKNHMNENGPDSNANPRALLCCAAQTFEEINHNELAYPMKKLHYVNHLSENWSNISENEKICERRLEPSVYKSSKPVDDFTTEANASLVIYQSGFPVCDLEFKLSTKDLPPLQGDQNCDFFSTFDILFDKSASVPQQVRYDLIVDPATKAINEKCDDFSIGYEQLTAPVGMAYAKSFQNDVLTGTLDLISKNVLVESRDTAKFDSQNTSEDNQDICSVIRKKEINFISQRELIPQEQVDYFIPQLLAVKNHFRDESLASSTCSHLNTAPMWKKVSEEAWKPVQNFVRNLASKLGKLSIITGTHGVLQLAQQTEDAKTCFTKKIYLSRNGSTIPVPRAFWTVAMYRSPGQGDDSLSTFYGMILVTSNNKIKELEEDICFKVSCDAYNWIGGEGTYCCAFSKENLTKLGVRVKELELTERISELNLNDIPSIVNHSGNLVPEE